MKTTLKTLIRIGTNDVCEKEKNVFNLFRRKNDTAAIADGCFEIFRGALGRIKNDILSGKIQDEDKRVFFEASLVVYAAVRSAINGASADRANVMMQVCQQFDQKVADTLCLDTPAFESTGIDLDQRLQSYFELLCNHSDEIQKGSAESFNVALGNRFTQCCLAGGEPNESAIGLGDLEAWTLRLWIVDLWWDAFPRAMRFLDSVRI